MKISISFLVFALILTLAPNSALAGECYSYPLIELDGSATVNSGVFVRTGACMAGTEVIATLAAGELVAVLTLDDGWYEIKRADGTQGWVWGDFLSVSADPISLNPPANTENPVEEEIVVAETIPDPVTTVVPVNQTLVERTKGYILLQVESHGEAWYVHPDTGYRYYMKDGPTAYEMMRAFGLGITDADLAGVQAGNSALVARLKGKILLQVEQLGEAYYVHPDDGTVHYMKDGAAAYELMRSFSLGITNLDLASIESKEFETVPYDEQPNDYPDAKVASDTNEVVDFQDIHVSNNQGGTVPSEIDVIYLNRYWLSRINNLRAKKGLRLLVLDQRFIDTASEYAAYMQSAQAYAHERADGSTMHEWIDEKGLDFTDRYALPDGWRTNYFTENITWGYSDNSNASVAKVLEDALDMYLSEESSNGPHYRTTYHEDWNTVGVGLYFEDLGSFLYKVYIVFHYGSLELN